MDRPETPDCGPPAAAKCVQFCPPIMCNLEPPLTQSPERRWDARGQAVAPVF